MSLDRAWNEKRQVFGVIAQNPLDDTGSGEVMAWAEAHMCRRTMFILRRELETH